jgi:hypothetical protein
MPAWWALRRTDVSSTARRIGVVAHFDFDGELAPYVRRLVSELLTVCERVALVSSSGIDPEGLEWVSAQTDVVFIDRPNVGYDFKGFHVGLEALDPIDGAEILLCNDSFFGPLIPLRGVIDRMAERDVDFWGITTSHEIEPHVQSYFLVIRPQVVESTAFPAFWSALGTPANRAEAIERGEMRFSRWMTDAGFRFGAYFEPTEPQAWLAVRRWAYWQLAVNRPRAAKSEWELLAQDRFLSDARYWFNPTVLLADAALDGSLPVVKLEAVRADPIGLGGRRLFESLELSNPDELSGAAEYLRRTARHYRDRQFAGRPVGDIRSLLETVGYRDRPAG